MTPQQIADRLDAEHAAQFAPVSQFDAPTFSAADLARVAGVSYQSACYHARRIHGFPATVEPKSWFLSWKRGQWPLVLLTFLKGCPKARRALTGSLGLPLDSTPVEELVWKVLGNPFKPTQSPA